MQEFAKRMLEGNKIKDSNGKNLLNEEQEALLKAVAESDRYKECKINNLAAVNGNSMWDAGRQSTLSNDAQWAAMTIDMNDGSGSSVVAMRGTDGTTMGWNEDFELGFEPGGTTAQRLSRDYLKSVDSDRMYLTGHSKAGNDVSSAYMMSDKSVRDKVVQVTNLDGPGHNPEFIENFEEGYKELSSKQRNIYPQDTIIGKLLNNNPGKQIYVHSNQEGHTDIPILGEHDTFSWELDGNGLKETRQSELSRILDEVTDSALKGLSSGERQHALDFLIRVGIPALIANDARMADHITIDDSTWQSLLVSTMNYHFTNMEELWATLRLLRSLIAELELRGIAKLTFRLPGEAEFILWIKDCFADYFRKFKNWAEDSWNSFWNGVYNTITHQNNEYHGVHYVDNTPVYDFDNNHQGEYASNIHVTEMFSVNPDALKSNASEIKVCSESIRNIAKELSSIKNSLSGIGRILAELPFDILIIKTNKRADETNVLGNALQNIANCYQITEDNVIANITPKGEGF
jgi:hypothetical protein